MADVNRKVRRTKKVPGARKIVQKELPTFSRQIAAMLESGMPLVQSLSALEEQTQNKAFRLVIIGVRQRVEGGAMFSDALAEYPDVFDELYVSMMRAGESGGMLAEIAGRVASYLESSARLRRKVKSAMMYPVTVMILALTMATAMVIWLVPVFSGIYEDFGANLPGPTKALMNLSNFIRGNGLVVAGVVAAIIYGFQRFKKSEKGAYLLDHMRLRFPLVGELALKISLGRFASTFAQLIHSGVPILEALDIVAYAVGNRVISRIILGAKGTIESGELLSTELMKHKILPRMMVFMLAAGEKTGKMDEMLEKVGQFYDDEVEATLEGLTAIIEPLLMVFLGVVVGGIVLCIFMPIFKLSDIISV
ncbi:MAG: type II secretion system F family protein [Candidatus Marinimicrobia bacterium]|nr:type II secretion system F family protein [Candidatus Neomarinimicrobiota bacterium]